MSNSIPADPSLVLGHLVDPYKVEMLQKIAEAENPQNLANEKLNNLVLSNYKIEMIYNQMVNLKVSLEDLMSLQDEKEKLKSQMAEAAIDLAAQTMICQDNVLALMDEMDQNIIDWNYESPVDFTATQVAKFPLSSDALKFDVQYFRNETNEEGVSSHASTVSSHVAKTFSAWNKPSTSSNFAESTNKSMLSQTSRHELEGTIVITATATHRQADIMSPVVLNAGIAFNTWNNIFQDDQLSSEATAIFNCALGKDGNDKDNALHLLTGATRGSSFVGFVHILRTESTTSSQEAESLASSVLESVDRQLFLASSTGTYGVSKSFADGAKKLMSTSQLTNHCTLTTEGVIANIAASDLSTVVKNLKPNPQEVMGQLAAIQGASNTGVNSSMEAMAQAGKTGAQFTALNSQHLKDTVSTLGEYVNENNKVIDTNSLMTAFEDYVQKATAGDCGVPINFYVKRVTKKIVATKYIQKYYPNGAWSQKDGMAGGIGW